MSQGCEIASLITNKTGTVRINVTLKRIRATVVSMEKQQELRILGVLALDIYSAVRMLHIVACGLSGFTAFCLLSHLINGTIFEKIKLCLVLFSLPVLSATFLIIKRNELDVL